MCGEFGEDPTAQKGLRIICSVILMDVTIRSPPRLQMIAESKAKNDRVDSEDLTTATVSDYDATLQKGKRGEMAAGPDEHE